MYHCVYGSKTHRGVTGITSDISGKNLPDRFAPWELMPGTMCHADDSSLTELERAVQMHGFVVFEGQEKDRAKSALFAGHDEGDWDPKYVELANNLEGMPSFEVRKRFLILLRKIVALERLVGEQRAEITRLKG